MIFPEVGGLQDLVPVVNIKDLMKEKEALAAAPEMVADIQDSLSVITHISQRAQATSAQPSMMSRNFFSSTDTESEYIAARKIEFTAQKQVDMMASGDVIANAMPDAVKEAAFWSGRRMRQAKIMRDTQEAHEQLFTEIREEIAEKAVPNTEEGQQFTGDTDDLGAELQPSVEVAPERALAGAPPVPVESFSGSLAGGLAEPVGESISSVTPSINIMV